MKTNLKILVSVLALLLGLLPEAQAAIGQFERIKPHVNATVINATDQAGNVLFSALFLCNVAVHPDGQADGVWKGPAAYSNLTILKDKTWVFFGSGA